MQPFPACRQVLCPRQPEAAAVGQFDEPLLGGSPEGAPTDELGPGVVGERRREEFGRPGRAVADEQHHRQLDATIARFGDGGFLRLVPALADRQRARSDEQAGRLHAVGIAAVGRAAQIDDKLLGASLLEGVDRVTDLVGHAGVERRHADVADRGCRNPAGHARLGESGAGEGDLLRLRRVAPDHRQRHHRAGRAAQALRALEDRDVAGRFTVDAPDVVARPQPSLRGGRTVPRREHPEIELPCERHARTPFRQRVARLERGDVAGRQVGAIGIEAARESPHRASHDAIDIDILDVAVEDEGDDVLEDAQRAIRVFLREGAAEVAAEHREHEDRCRQEQYQQARPILHRDSHSSGSTD